MALTDLDIISRSLRARLFSTLVGAASVAIAVALLLVLLGMRDSGRRAFERGSGNAQLVVSRDASPMVSILNSVFLANPPARPLSWDQVAALQADPRVAFALPLQQGDSYRGFPVVGVAPGHFLLFSTDPAHDPIERAARLLRERRPDMPARAAELAAGEFVRALSGQRGGEVSDAGAIGQQTLGEGGREIGLAARDDLASAWRADSGSLPAPGVIDPWGVVLGSSVARETGLIVGDRITLTHGIARSRLLGGTGAASGGDPHEHDEFSWTVRAVLRPSGTSFDRALFSSLESAWAVHALDRRRRSDPNAAVTLADITDADREVTGVYVAARTRAALPSLAGELRRDPTLVVASPGDEVRRLFAIVGSVDQLFLAMALAVMASSGVGILLAMYNSMEQRRRQIAILRVLGSSPARIFGLILTESAIIGMIGTGAGILLGLVASSVAAGVLKAQLGLVIDAVLPLRAVLSVAAGSILLAAMAGVIPGVVGYRTSVARNLRPLG